MPQASSDAPITVRFAGVSTLVFNDGETAWMTDGFFTRPSWLRVGLTKIEPDRAAIEQGLKRLGVEKLAAVIPLHSHYDHAMDAPLTATQTGAMLIGSESTLNIGRGLGMSEDRMLKVTPDESISLGKWKLTFIKSRHAPPDDHSGPPVDTIDKPLVPPAASSAWAVGDTWTLFVEHKSGARMLVIGSAGFEPSSLDGIRADTVFLGIALLHKQPEDYKRQWWDENVKSVGARRIIPIHWDDFGRSLEDPLVALPYVADNVGATMSEISDWSRRDGVELRMPPQFTPFAP
ncbi:MAG TPA: MBL fold metallo-hydrolase [Chloroflexia bacterium]|nr:MBL fold metallo-hydrolase [Chloroflexia bacterium]